MRGFNLGAVIRLITGLFRSLTMKHFFYILILFILVACSSNSNDRGVYKKSTQYVNLLDKSIPVVWRKINSEGADYALENKVTGSIFVFTSACRNYDQSSLTNLTSSMLSSLGRPTVLEKRKLNHQGRESEIIKFQASVDGITRYLYTLTLQKNDCIYDYALIATSLKNLDIDLEDFIRFSNAIVLK